MKQSKIGNVRVVMLGVSDLQRSIEFYKCHLGLDPIMQEPQLALLKAGETIIGLNRGLAQMSDHLVGAVEVVFGVESVKEWFGILSTKGLRFIKEPNKVTPTDWAATFTDPDGHKLSLFGKE
jgi:catechol 2,3-dioxygenase-like lactoylglutathione lyase family enzyme